MKDLSLYGYWRSSASWRVRTGLHLLGLPFRYVAVHLVQDGGHQYAAEHTARNPLQQVPVLAWTEDGVPHRLTQSLPILELLSEARGGQLLPSEAYPRARARQLAEMVNSGIQPFQNLWLSQALDAAGMDGRAFGKHAIERGLHAIERELELAEGAAGGPGQWMVGDAPSLADICLIPQLYNARRFAIDLTPMPRLLAVEALAAQHPAFLAAHPDVQPDAVHP